MHGTMVRVVIQAVLATQVLLPLAVAAAPFGESKTVTNGTPVCPGDGTLAAGVLTTLPVEVGVDSRIFVVVSVSTGAHSAGAYAAITRGANMPVLGTIENGFQAWQSGQEQQTRPPIVVQGVMHASSNPVDPSATPLTLAPGSYQLQLRVYSTGNCGQGFGATSATLTYILLSSSYDRIYADGFA